MIVRASYHLGLFLHLFTCKWQSLWGHRKDLPAWHITRPFWDTPSFAWQARISLFRPFLLKSNAWMSRPFVSLGLRSWKELIDAPHWKLSRVNPFSTNDWRHSGDRAALMSSGNSAVAPVVIRHSLVIFPWWFETDTEERRPSWLKLTPKTALWDAVTQMVR